LLEFKNFKSRDKYLISNNLEINGISIETLEKKPLEEKSRPTNYELSPNKRFDYINNDCA